jgi:ribonuclease P protein component
MLPKLNRIKKKKDFEIIFKGARGASQSFKNYLFVVKALKNNLNINRFGFVVSTKISKKATIRNKVRRRLVEAIQPEIEKIKNGTDLVLIALPGIEKKKYFEIKEAVNSMLAKAKLII